VLVNKTSYTFTLETFTDLALDCIPGLPAQDFPQAAVKPLAPPAGTSTARIMAFLSSFLKFSDVT
jgi:hypothetical protein